MNILSFGEILWDIIHGENHLGGAPFNFAAHSVKCGGKATLISAVGDDAFGIEAIRQAKVLGVDVSFIQSLHNRPTGTVDVFLENGQPDYTIHEQVAFDYILSLSADTLHHKTFDIFYFGTLAQRSSVSRAALKTVFKNMTFKHVFYDINIRKDFYTKEIIDFSLKQCSVFKINDAEVELLSGIYYGKNLPPALFAAKISEDFNIPTVIVTAAEKGCYIYSKGQFTHVAGEVVKVADAVGAGDSFSAAFMSIFGATGDAIKAAKLANKVGAFVASQRGAIPEYPKELMEALYQAK